MFVEITCVWAGRSQMLVVCFIITAAESETVSKIKTAQAFSHSALDNRDMVMDVSKEKQV